MNVTVENTGPCRKTLHIEIPEDVIKAQFESTTDLYLCQISLPGFRKGKVPRKIVQNRFEKQLVEQVQDEVLRDATRKAIEQEAGDAVAVLDIKRGEFKRDAPYVFQLVLDVPPDFETPVYKGLELKRYPVEVSQEDVDQAVEILRVRNATYREITDRPVQSGDLVRVDYEGVCEGQPIDNMGAEAQGVGVGKDCWIEIGAGNLFLPGIEQALPGTPIGEKKQVDVTFPDDFRVSCLAGKNALYFVDICQINERMLPDLDEDFFKKINVASEQELRERVEKQLQSFGDHRARRMMILEASRKLLSDIDFEPPESEVHAELGSVVQDIVQENTKRGVSREQIEEHHDEIMQSARISAVEHIKLRYILLRIAKEEHIEITDEEYESHIAQLAQANDNSPQVFKEKFEKRKDTIEHLKNQLLCDKTLEMIIDHAQID